MESLADEMQRNHSLSKEIFQLKKTNELLKSHTHSMQANFDKRIRKLLKNWKKSLEKKYGTSIIKGAHIAEKP